MTSLTLTSTEEAILRGDRGPAARFAMEVLVRMGEMEGAREFVEIEGAHIDSCLFHGDVALDFVEMLVDGGGQVVVPTTLNVGLLDLLHPELFTGDPALAEKGRRLMEAYQAMGCEPSFTCAPYQLSPRPTLGQQIAWAESNAIVFANSVLGARTNRYGDFIDICAALTGRVPYTGLHRTEGRRGQVVFDLSQIPGSLLEKDVIFPVLGHLIGGMVTSEIPVLVGLSQATSEDDLKAVCAAAASSGGVAMFHAVGITPEAPSLEAALRGHEPERVVQLHPSQVAKARDELTTDHRLPLAAVCLGTPHFSLNELRALAELLGEERVHGNLDLFVSTSRHVLGLAREEGIEAALEGAGARIVVDTCTYLTPLLLGLEGLVMTNSAKWAYYGPGNVGVEVAFGSLEECVRSAVKGEIWRDDALWAGL